MKTLSIGIALVAVVIAAYAVYRMVKAYVSNQDEGQGHRKPEDIAWCLIAELYEMNAKFEEEPMHLVMAMILWREKVDRMEPLLMSQVGADFADEMALKTSCVDPPATRPS